MFKIGLENRDFCKSLHFYIDAGKKKKNKKKNKKKQKKTRCICWLVQLLSALRAEDIALRAMPSLFVFLVLRGACQRPDMDSQKQLKLCRFPQRTCKLMRLKVVIWILIAARSWQWAVVARNKQNFTFISFNAGTVKEYTVTWMIFILPPWRGSIIRYGRNREFTLIRSVNSRLFDTIIHAYSMREFTLIRCVNARLYKASIITCTDVKSCQRIQRILRFWIMLLRVTRIFLATTAHCHDRAAIKIYITTFNRINLHVRCGNLHNFNCFWLSISFFFVLVKAILHL